MTFRTYLSYSSSNRDEMPLYLFDKHFTAVAPSLEADYDVPPHFGEDLFGLLGEQGRPDYRWEITGGGGRRCVRLTSRSMCVCVPPSPLCEAWWVLGRWVDR